MAEKKFTEAGKFGQSVKSALANAYRGFNSGFTKYVQEPALNFYPQVIANPTYAATEAVAGALDTPLDLGRFPYYNIETEEERNNRLLQESEPKEPTPTLANRDLLSEYYGGFDNVPLKKATPVSKKLYRVMYAGRGAESSEVYDTKEEADAALKKAGGKGAVAGVNLQQKTRGGERLSADETEARKQKYEKQLNQSKMDKIVYDEQLKRAKSPEYKAALQERSRLANEAKLAKDKQAGTEFASWTSKVKAGRAVEGALNDYSNQLGLLKSAYSQARQSGNPLAAYQIQEYIQEYQAGIPKEMGARKKFAESGALQERTSMLKQKMEEARQQAERERRLSRVNPDYNR
jgi:hypothetical protein